MNAGHAAFREGGRHCRAAIEDLPHLAEKMCYLWNSRDLNDFVQDVLLDTRDGQRRGLPPEVANEMIFISRLNTLVRAMDAAPKLKVSLQEAGDILAAGDRIARGLPPASADPWGEQDIRLLEAPILPPRAPTPPRPAAQPPRGSTSYYVSLFLNEAPPIPALARIDLTARGTGLSPAAPAAMEREFFRCIAREIRDSGVDELVLSHTGAPERCSWVAEAVLYAKQHCHFPQVGLRVDALAASERQMDEAIAAGLDSLTLEFPLANPDWRARAEAKLAGNSNWFAARLSHLLHRRDEIHGRTQHRCLIKVVQLGKPVPNSALGAVVAGLGEMADACAAEWLPEAGAAAQEPEDCLCWGPFVEANIRTGGDLVACAHDEAGATRVADLKRTEFGAAWHHAEFRRTRRSLLEGKPEGGLCAACPRRAA